MKQLSLFPDPPDPRPPETVTWNLWHGCTKVSSGCSRCYMYRRDEKVGKDPTIVRKTQSFKNAVMDTFCRLSEIIGINSIGWRYDPILINDAWTVDRHISVFSSMAEKLSGYTHTCVISFIDLYEKVKRNYPEAKRVTMEDQEALTSAFVDIGKQHGMVIKPCAENKSLENLGADCSGCMTVKTFETAIGQNLDVPRNPNNRKECACFLTGDIGAYNTCGHLCRYCYANADKDIVLRNMRMHDPRSPYLIGREMPGDVGHQAKQVSWIDPQMRLDLDLLMLRHDQN